MRIIRPRTENVNQKAQRQRKSGIVVPNQVVWHGRIAAFAIYAVGRTLESTWRIDAEDRTGLFGEGNKPVIFAVWHNRLAISMAAYRQVKRWQPGSGLAALISASKDGALLTKALEHFGIHAVRGSSSRRGAQALLELATWIERGCHVAITPDGPRGPKYIVQEGIIALAKVTGRPILPVGARIHSKKRLRSWDQFQIPLPFARCELIFDVPLHVPRDASEEQQGQLRAELQQRLLAITPD